MPSFKFVKQSGTKGGDAARMGVDGGITNSRKTSTSRGKVATGTYSQSAARISDKHAANGVPSSLSKTSQVNSGSIMKSGGQKKGALPTGSAFSNANARVTASGATPKVSAKPSLTNGKNKNLTRGTPMSAGFAQPMGYSGSSNGRSALGQTGSGIGGRKKFSAI